MHITKGVGGHLLRGPGEVGHVLGPGLPVRCAASCQNSEESNCRGSVSSISTDICKSLGSMQTFYRLYNFINLHCIPFIEPLSHLIGSAHLRNGDFEKDGTKDEFQCSLQNMLFSDCMQRFLYVRCYNSSEVTAALKASSLCISQKVTSLFACSYICCSLLP